MSPGGHPEDRLLWLLRHAKASAEPPRGATDHERPLTPRGRRDGAALGHRIRAGDLGFGSEPPQLVLSSTAARTAETAQLVAGPIGVPVDVRRRLYYGSPDDLLDEVRTVDDGVRSLLVVGHNPAVHSVALELLDDDAAGAGGGRVALASFPTCGLAVLAVVAPSWGEVTLASASLVGFVRPPYTTG